MAAASAVLLAGLVALRRDAPAPGLDNAQRQALKTALELPDAAIAVTSNGEFLGIYPNSALALEASLAFHRAVESLAAVGAAPYTGRVVLDLWPATSENMPVEHAREILRLAREHCVLVTPAFAGEMPAAQRADLMHYLSEKDHPVLRGVCELSWRDRATTFRESTRQVSLTPSDTPFEVVRLVRRGKVFLVRPGDCPFTLGRDAACALNIGGPNVSRLHGAILFEGGRFYLRDDSRNGSFLTTGGEEIFLQAERFLLGAKGLISPGATLVQQTGDVIQYACLTKDPGDPVEPAETNGA